MTFSLAVQTTVFLKAIIIGLGVGLVYDILRAVRWEMRAGPVPTGALDALFWVISILAFTLFVLITADGNGRYYIFIGMGAGCSLYLLTISPLVLRIICYIVRILKRILGIVLRCITHIAQTAETLLKKILPKKSWLKKIKKSFLFHVRWYRMK